jgi:hypothetical protein
MHYKKIIITLSALVSASLLESYFVVYNLRISELNRRQATTNKHSLLTSTFFNQWYTMRDGSKARDTGLLLTYIHTQDSWYIKLDAAGAHVRVLSADCMKLQRNQSDDFLISGGYGLRPREGTAITFTGYFGIPTHKDTALDNIEFGSGHYSIGPQVDGIQAYKVGKPHYFLWALRSLYFFRRALPSNDPTITTCHTLWPGNIMDIYLGHQSNWSKVHRIEFGYDLTFSFATHVRPNIVNFSPGLPFVRNTYFVSYIRRIKGFDTPSSLLFTLTYATDPRPPRVGRRYSVALFIAWAINF